MYCKKFFSLFIICGMSLRSGFTQNNSNNKWHLFSDKPIHMYMKTNLLGYCNQYYFDKPIQRFVETNYNFGFEFTNKKSTRSFVYDLNVGNTLLSMSSFADNDTSGYNTAFLWSGFWIDLSYRFYLFNRKEFFISPYTSYMILTEKKSLIIIHRLF